MDLSDLQTHWNALGEQDPLWAIMSDPSRRGNRWNLEEFFDWGVREVDEIFNEKDRLQFLPTAGVGRALDFGCGVGRLTQALAARFATCDGVDIAASMIEHARLYNRFGDRCRYHLNTQDDLALFQDDSFDFILTIAVLQHMEPRYALKYLQEFLRVLAPRGIAVFQLPSKRRAYLPFDDSAYRARVEILSVPECWSTGRHKLLHTRVWNDGTETWPRHVRGGIVQQIRLGNHWLDSAGTLLILDDGRAELPRNVEPGEHIDINLDLKTPSTPGDYLLELDMVHESVTWFRDKGSPTCRAAINVEPVSARLAELRLEDRPSATPAIEPVIEMHGVLREEVVSSIESRGGRVLDVKACDLADWLGFRYVATKP